MKPKQIKGIHHILFNYKNGASKKLVTSSEFERYVFNDKGYIKEDVIESLCKDEDKKYGLKSCEITYKNDTVVKFFV